MELDLDQIFAERFSSVAFQKHVGMKLDRIEGTTIHASIENAPELMGNEMTEILHGGVIASIIDAVGGFVAGQAARLFLEEKGEALDRIQLLATIDLRVDYFSPGRGKFFTIVGKPLKVGSRSISTRMEVHNDQEELIAAGSANFIY